METCIHLDPDCGVAGALVLWEHVVAGSNPASPTRAGYRNGLQQLRRKAHWRALLSSDRETGIFPNHPTSARYLKGSPMKRLAQILLCASALLLSQAIDASAGYFGWHPQVYTRCVNGYEQRLYIRVIYNDSGQMVYVVGPQSWLPTGRWCGW